MFLASSWSSLVDRLAGSRVVTSDGQAVVMVVVFAAVGALDAVLPCWEQAARATAGRRATIASALRYFGGANHSRLVLRGAEGMAEQNSLLDCEIFLAVRAAVRRARGFLVPGRR
jgi:hypothetical protein